MSNSWSSGLGFASCSSRAVIVDSQRLLDNLELMEKRPFDGVVIAIVGRTGDGKPCHLRAAFHNQPWHKEWFEESVDRLKQCQFKAPQGQFGLRLPQLSEHLTVQRK